MESMWQASTNLNSSSCQIRNSDEGLLDAIAGTKLIISLLSILGCSSIIASVIMRRQVTSPKVHPIFVLSVADLMLAILWAVGPILFFERISNRVWCFCVSLLTVILECITMNLTLVYALHAYSSVRRRHLCVVQRNLNKPGPEHACGPWYPLKTISVYVIAWIIPVVIVMIPFGVISGKYHIVRDANSYSCWCMPHFGNVVPFAFPHSKDQPIWAFVLGVKKLVLTYGAILGVNYLVVFVLLVAVYYKVWTYIRLIRSVHDQTRTSRYGTVKFLINGAEFRAKRRIVYFLNVFIINGFANVILSFLFVVHEAQETNVQGEDTDLNGLLMVVFFMQSATVPLQGLLNAMVYGWTREDFANTMAIEEDIGPESQTLLDQSDPVDIAPNSGLLFSGKQPNNSESDSDQMEETELETELEISDY